MHISSVKLPALKKMSAARREIGQHLPYLMPAILALVPREAPGLGTLGVTKRLVLYYDPALVDRLDHKKLATILAHEVGHVMREHANRAERMHLNGKYELFTWNRAGDITINDDLRQIHSLTWPQVKDFFPDGSDPEKRNPEDTCALFSDTYGFDKNQTTESYYRLLQEYDKNQQQNGQGQQQGDGEGATVMSGACGGAAGNPGDEEPGGGKDPMERSEADVQTIRQSVARAIKDYAASGRGSVPGGFGRWADDFLKPPQIKWDEKFRRAIKRTYQWVAGQQLAKFNKMSRRQPGAGFGLMRPILPKLQSPKPHIGFIVDTSGSMGHDELSTAASECAAIIRRLKATISFLSNDAGHDGIKKVNSVADLARNFKGGGGTDFRPAIETLRALPRRKRPDIVVFVTDGCGPAPVTPPNFHLIWVLVGGHASKPYKASDDGGWNDGGKVDYGEFIWVGDACAVQED